MYCVIQEIEQKKINKNGCPKELISEYMKMTINGIDMEYYTYHYSQERFERPIKKAYKISIHKSYRENGKPRKKQFVLCTVGYYELAADWFSLYDSSDSKITEVAKELDIDTGQIYDIVESKLEPLIEKIQGEFQQTKEYKTHVEHERITTLYAVNKAEFTEKYQCSSSKYDEIYDVFGNLMNKEKLEEIKAEFEARKEYEEKSRSYQDQYYSNYNNDFTGSGGSSYSNNIFSNHNTEDKETLKQFYRVLSKKFHPDSNPDTDTSKQMQLLNQLKNEWGV